MNTRSCDICGYSYSIGTMCPHCFKNNTKSIVKKNDMEFGTSALIASLIKERDAAITENTALRDVLREVPDVWVDLTFEAQHVEARETARYAVQSIIDIACKRRGVTL